MWKVSLCLYHCPRCLTRVKVSLLLSEKVWSSFCNVHMLREVALKIKIKSKCIIERRFLEFYYLDIFMNKFFFSTVLCPSLSEPSRPLPALHCPAGLSFPRSIVGLRSDSRRGSAGKGVTSGAEMVTSVEVREVLFLNGNHSRRWKIV